MAFADFIGDFTFGFFFGWLRSWLFWIVLLLAFLLVVIGSLLIRKRRKLQYPVVELTDLGKGKIGMRRNKAGWFRSKTLFFGLYDYAGEEYLKTKDKRTIQQASSEDFHDIGGKRGLVVYRKSDDPAILAPVSKMELKNRSLMNEVAPADYRDASVKIMQQAQRETMSGMEKFAQYAIPIFMGIIFILAIIFIVQMVKSSQAEAKELILEAGKYAQSCKEYLQALPPASGAP